LSTIGNGSSFIYRHMSLKDLMRCILIILATILVAIPVLCQTPESKRPSFEVATVKPAEPGPRRISGISIQPGGRLVIKNMTLRNLLIFAYNVRDSQVAGGPNWMRDEAWDIEARAEEGSIPAPTGPPDPSKPNPMAIRLQSLLEERFQLKTHTE